MGDDDRGARGSNGHTYRSDGSIYFKISTLPEYGKLARLDHAGIKSGARVDSDKYDKENARDFVLWKATKPGEPTWDPGIGPGRPGWHIECSAMALRLLGEPPIDIHAGGVDLIFPHHENEIAQSEGATGRPFSRFWVHVEHLMIEERRRRGEKMSKSLGNVYNLQDVVDRGFRPSALRYLYLGVHYRKQLRFSWAAMAQAEEALTRLTDFLARLESLPRGGDPNPDGRRGSTRRAAAFAAHIAADLNTAGGARRDVRSRARAEHRDRRGGAGPADAARGARRRSIASIACSGVLALRRAEDERPPVPVEEIERADRGAARRPAGAQLRRGGSHPRGSRGARHRARGHRLDDAVEEEVIRAGIERDPAAGSPAVS